MLLATLPDTTTANNEPGVSADARVASRIQRLRLDTRQAHDAIEGVPCMRRLLAPDYTLNEYRRLLARLMSYVAPLESRMAARSDAQFNLGCARTPKLAADLAALGARDTRPAEIAMAFDRLDFDDESTRAGIVYVFEGATLGGQVIRRALVDHLGQVVVNALSYFDCYGGAQGSVWRRTIHQIETADVDDQRMIAAARTIFASLCDWLIHSDVPMARPVSSAGRCPFAHAAQAAGA